MKQPHERGELGAWLVEQRKRLGEERGARVTQQVVVDELGAQGYPMDASYYRAIESGSKKSAGHELREALGRYFGRTPPSPTGRVVGETDLGRLVAAIETQTEAINRLVDAMALDDDGLPARVAQQIAVQLGLLPSPDDEDAREESGEPRDTGRTAPRRPAKQASR